MKLLLIVAMSAVLVSCSSSPFKEETKKADEMMEHLSQNVRYSGDGFPEKYEKSGQIGRYVIGIGKSIYPMNYNEQMSEAAAVSNAKMNIVNSAPTMFSSIVEKTLSTDLNIQEFHQKDISITKVKNLKGIEVKPEDVLCLKRIEPIKGKDKYRISRECRSLAKVSIDDLKKAYDLTLSSNLSKKVSKKSILQTMN